MKTMEMSQHEQNDLFAIVASVLHMGNVGFTEEDGVAQILKPASVEAVAAVSVLTQTKQIFSSYLLVLLNFIHSYWAVT